MADQTAQDSWNQLDEPWRVAIQMAWEAHCADNVGVGAVVTDEAGTIVAKGRNRTCDRQAPPGRLHHTWIAHAEIDALGQLPPAYYGSHTIWTTLEPCLMCSSAIFASNVGKIHFVARDRLWDLLARLPDIGGFVAERWPERHGPLDGPIAAFCELLPLVWFCSNKDDGRVVRQYAECHPALLHLARGLTRTDLLSPLEDQSPPVVLGHLWDRLLEASGPA